MDGSGPAAVTGDGMDPLRGSLSSELVWRALLYAFRLRVVRDGWDGDADDGNDTPNPSSDANARIGVHRDNHPGSVVSDGQASNTSAAAAATAATVAARRSRQKDTSVALWHCVRLLLAASPFSEEFAVGPAGQISSAVTATAAKTKAAAAAQQSRDRYALLRSAAAAATSPASSTSVLLAPKETFTHPEMVARVVLERVLVLARAYPPDAGNHGIVEKLWEGVQCVSRASCGALPSSVANPGVSVGGAAEVDCRDFTAGSTHPPQAEVDADGRAYERLRSVRRLGRWSASLQENADSSSSSSGETTRLSYVHLW